MKKNSLLLTAIVLLTWCVLPAKAIDRNVVLDYKIFGYALQKSPKKTSLTLDGKRCAAYVLGEVAQEGTVYYLPDKKILVMEDATIESEKTDPIFYSDEEVRVHILLKGNNTIRGKGTLVSTKGEVTFSAWPGERASLTLSSPLTAIQCGTILTFSRLEAECTESRYAFMCTGGRDSKAMLVINECVFDLKASKECIKGFKDVVTVKCGLNYDEYEDQRIAYSKKEQRMTHNEQPCKELPIVNTDMYIPINTTGETWYWLSERAKPETATEESDDNEDTSSVSSDDEEEEQRTAIASFDVREEEPAIEEEEEDTPAETSIVSTNVTANNTPQPSNDNEGIVRVPEQYPDFQGGQAALIKYLNENIQYPNIAKENGVQGRVMVRIVVEKDGTLSDVQIVRSVDPSLDKEALRVVKASSGMWKPGYQRGKPVRTEWTVPVAFRLTEK